MKRLLVVVFSLVSSLVLAHGVNFSQLQGVKLCIDPRSVLVVTQLEDATQNNPQGQAVQTRLYTSLRSTLVNYQVPFVEKKLCSSKDGFVYSAFTSFLLTWVMVKRSSTPFAL
jgi:hypothetical protein